MGTTLIANSQKPVAAAGLLCTRVSIWWRKQKTKRLFKKSSGLLISGHQAIVHLFCSLYLLCEPLVTSSGRIYRTTHSEITLEEFWLGANSLVCTSLRQPHPLDLRSLPHYNCSNISQVHYSNVCRSESERKGQFILRRRPQYRTDFDFASKKSASTVLMPVKYTSTATLALYFFALLREAVAQNESVEFAYFCYSLNAIALCIVSRS